MTQPHVPVEVMSGQGSGGRPTACQNSLNPGLMGRTGTNRLLWHGNPSIRRVTEPERHCHG